jgi:hypothetical protein
MDERPVVEHFFNFIGPYIVFPDALIHYMRQPDNLNDFHGPEAFP